MNSCIKFTSIAAIVALLVSCGSSKTFLYNTTPEESGLNLTKITDEHNTSVIGNYTPYKIGRIGRVDYSTRHQAFSRVDKREVWFWETTNSISLSPDGLQIAHLSKKNDQANIVICDVSGSHAETQRTFRNVTDVFWGSDDNLYFSDAKSTGSYTKSYSIASIPAKKGSLMSQITNSGSDTEPATVDGGKTIFFTRNETGGPSIWRYTSDGGALTFCSRGFNPCLIPGNQDAFYCVRNNSEGKSEIWFVDFVNGREVCVLSDESLGFVQPSLSPDGQWILCVGLGYAPSKKVHNLDIFVVRTDGTRLTQLTNHPDADVCPIWSNDGKTIYFVSTRANKEQFAHIWKMNFTL